MILAERLGADDRVARELIETEHLIGLLQIKASRLAAELSKTKLWDQHGYNNAGDWMRFNCYVTNTVAWDRILVGEKLDRMPESEQAVFDGEIGYAHLKVMARTADVVGNAFDESKLLPLAKETSPGKFYYKSLHYRHSVDARSYSNEQAELRCALHWSRWRASLASATIAGSSSATRTLWSSSPTAASPPTCMSPPQSRP